jgi:hypothetical protein
MSIWRDVKAGITRAFTKEEPERWTTIRCNDYGRAPIDLERLDEPETRVRYRKWAEQEEREGAEALEMLAEEPGMDAMRSRPPRSEIGN